MESKNIKAAAILCLVIGIIFSVLSLIPCVIAKPSTDSTTEFEATLVEIKEENDVITISTEEYGDRLKVLNSAEFINSYESVEPQSIIVFRVENFYVDNLEDYSNIFIVSLRVGTLDLITLDSHNEVTYFGKNYIKLIISIFIAVALIVSSICCFVVYKKRTKNNNKIEKVEDERSNSKQNNNLGDSSNIILEAMEKRRRNNGIKVASIIVGAIVCGFIILILGINIEEQERLDFYFRLVIYIYLGLVLVYFFIVTPIILKIQTTKARSLIKEKKYSELSVFAKELLRSNGLGFNSASIYLTSLVFEKKYDEFIQLYHSYEKYMSFTPNLCFLGICFLKVNKVNERRLNSLLKLSKFTSRKAEKKLLLKLSKTMSCECEEVLKIDTTAFQDNEFYEYVSLECELVAKEKLGLDTKDTRNKMSKSIFNL